MSQMEVLQNLPIIKLQDLQDKVDEAADTLEEKQNQVNENLESL